MQVITRRSYSSYLTPDDDAGPKASTPQWTLSASISCPLKGKLFRVFGDVRRCIPGSPRTVGEDLERGNCQLNAIFKRVALCDGAILTRIVTSSLPLLVFNMGSISQEPRRLFQWTVCAYRKPGMSEEDYHKYMSEKHAPLVRGLLAKYGIIKFTMTHNTTETRKLMTKIAGPQFDNHADYDSLVQAVFKDVEDFVRMKADPFFIEVVGPDHENFADTTRSRYVGPVCSGVGLTDEA